MRIFRTMLNAQPRRRGFTLIELAIVLAVVGLMVGGLWRLMASGNTQLRDQAAAEQHKQLIAGVQNWLADSTGAAWMAANANMVTNLPLPGAAGTPATLANFLPPGFTNTTTNSYGQTYLVQVNRGAPNAAGLFPRYSFMIVTQGGDVIADTSGGRITAMIGSRGGFIYNTAVCPAAAPVAANACGAYGSWAIDPTAPGPDSYAFPVAAAGHIASRTFAGIDDETPWLARRLMNPPTEWNTMHTDMFFEAGGNDLFMQANTIDTGNGPILTQGGRIDTGGGNVNTNTGWVNLGGGILDGGSANSAIQNMTTATFGPPPPFGIALTSTNASIGPMLNALRVGGPGCVNDMAGGTCIAVRADGDVNVSGTLQAANLWAGTFIYTSDLRLKHDIRFEREALSKLGQLKAYSFTMDGTNEKKMGVMAQEVEKVYPQLVQTTSNGYKAVDYIGLIGPLVGAVNELKAQNEALRQEVEGQKAEIARLKSRR